MNEKLVAALQEYGLSEKESNVYLSVLSLGESKVFDIAQKAGLLRETTYSILASLSEKELITIFVKNKIKHYSASDPRVLLSLIKEKEFKILQNIPELLEISKTKPMKTKLNYFEGAEGLKTAYQEIIRKPNSEIRAFVNGKFVLDILPIFSHNILRKRVSNKINSKLLIDDSKESLEFLPSDKKELRESKSLSFIKDLNIAVYMFDNAVALLSLNKIDPMAIIIDNNDLYKALNLIHENFWIMAKKV